jgi:hypothetical protein
LEVIMSKRTWAGIISGLIYGAVIFWGAASPALSVGGIVALAAAVVGLAGAVGGGGLVALIIAACPIEEKKEAKLVELPEDYRAAA